MCSKRTEKGKKIRYGLVRVSVLFVPTANTPVMTNLCNHTQLIQSSANILICFCYFI